MHLFTAASKQQRLQTVELVSQNIQRLFVGRCLRLCVFLRKNKKKDLFFSGFMTKRLFWGQKFIYTSLFLVLNRCKVMVLDTITFPRQHHSSYLFVNVEKSEQTQNKPKTVGLKGVTTKKLGFSLKKKK